MAASYTWPITLPQKPLMGSFTEDNGFAYLQTNMDSGVSKIRKRGNRGSMMNMTFMMTTSQVAALKTFTNTTISGVARFNFMHPRTGGSIEVRIVPSSEGALYSVNQAAPGYWNVSLTFQEMP